MKQILLLLVLVCCIYSACTVLDLASSSNITLEQGNCIQINGTNNQTITIFAKNYTSNQTFYVNATQNLTDPLSQNRYLFQPTQYNINKTAIFGECIDIKEEGIHFCAPPKPILNKITNLAPGGADLLPDWGYSCYAPPKLNIKKQLKFEESFVNDAYGIEITGTPKLNLYISLTANNSKYVNTDANITVDYHLSQTEYEFMCNSLMNHTPQVWMNQTLPSDCSSGIIPFCPDKLTPYCTVQEIYQNSGAYNCLNRIAISTATQYNQTQQDLELAQATITGLRGDLKARDDSANANWWNSVQLILIAGLVFLSIWLFIQYWNKRKEEKESGVKQ